MKNLDDLSVEELEEAFEKMSDEEVDDFLRGDDDVPLPEEILLGPCDLLRKCWGG